MPVELAIIGLVLGVLQVTRLALQAWNTRQQRLQAQQPKVARQLNTNLVHGVKVCNGRTL